MTSIQETKQGLHSYEEFTQRPFYIEINKETIRLAPKPVKYAIDVATGTGAMITQMFDEKKLTIDFQIRGYDIDEKALRAAKSKFYHYRDRILFMNAPAENLYPQDKWAQLVTFCNAIHLTDAPKALKEITRVMDDDATLLINTAYEKDRAYPDGSEVSWGSMVALARISAKKNHGIDNIPKPAYLLNYSADDYVNMLVAAGLSDIEIYYHTAKLRREDLEAICRYDEFARGTLPGVDLDLAKELLAGAVEPTLERRKSDFLPRGWTIIKARKLPKAT